MIGFGILGCGSAGVPVAQAIVASSQTRLECVFDLDTSLAQDLAKRCGARAAASLEELLNCPQVAAVYIAVPHHLLHSLASQVLQAGKHALVEKPMALQMAQADELVALAETRRLVLGVYYEMHHAGPYQMARRMVQENALGPLIGVRIQTLIDKPLYYWESGYSGRALSPWRGERLRAGGGVLLMNSSHLLEATRYITALEVEQVTGVTATLVAPVEVEDLAAATLVYTNGAVGSLMAGAHFAGARLGDERIDLFGAQGQLKLPDPYGSDPLQVYLRRPWGDLEAGVWHSLHGPPTDVHRAAVEEFAAAVENGKPLASSGVDARQVLAIILAIYHSAAEKRMIRTSEVRTIETQRKPDAL